MQIRELLQVSIIYYKLQHNTNIAYCSLKYNIYIVNLVKICEIVLNTITLFFQNLNKIFIL